MIVHRPLFKRLQSQQLQRTQAAGRCFPFLDYFYSRAVSVDCTVQAYSLQRCHHRHIMVPVHLSTTTEVTFSRRFFNTGVPAA